MSRDDEIEKILRGAKAAHMSNAKWKKLFEACEKYGEPIGGVSWKFIWSDASFKNTICVSENLIDEKRFGDCDPSPYAELREIEWIEIPRKYEDPKSDPKRRLPEKYNDISSLILYLSAIAEFPIIENQNSIKIVGYEWG